MTDLAICKFETCEKLVGGKSARGYCHGHYKQVLKGRPLTELQVRRKGALCSFEGCTKPHDGHGFCMGHNRQRREEQELRPLRQYLKEDGTSGDFQLCRSCHEVKILSEFHNDVKQKKGVSIHCKDCTRLKDKMRMFNLVKEDITKIIQNQNGECPICGDQLGKSFAVDHDHSCCPGEKSCGKCVRGFLHRNCNSGIGLLRDDADICERAASYLRKYSDG